mmetsp:Transcript_17249/g.52458  ORF Transcript_17249/g.52458 Transcript_17249/m.52458 type:complete len:84 (+) Transcript_17249:3862-4113(+)
MLSLPSRLSLPHLWQALSTRSLPWLLLQLPRRLGLPLTSSASTPPPTAKRNDSGVHSYRSLSHVIIALSSLSAPRFFLLSFAH